MDSEIVVGVTASDAAMRAVAWAADLAAARRLSLVLLFVGDPGAGQVALADAAVIACARGAAPLTAEAVPGPVGPVLRARSATARLLVLGASGRSGALDRALHSPTLVAAPRAGCPVVVVRGRERPAGPVVAGVDGAEDGEQAIAVAFDEAARRSVPLVALHARSRVEYRTATTCLVPRLEWEPVAEHHHRAIAERLAGWQERYPDVVVRRVVTPDRPVHHLLRWSRRAQLVIVGSRGRSGLAGLVLGSTGRMVTGTAACPVMIVPAQHGPESPCRGDFRSW